MTGRITVAPGECHLIPDFLPCSQGFNLFGQLQNEAEWAQHKVRIFNHVYDTPRLTAWYGDDEAVYRYSGSTHVPLPWIAPLDMVRRSIEQHTGTCFNSVLLNYYRNGDDCMGRHSDDEHELGPCPLIASLSLGGKRKFVLHPKKGNDQATRNILLPHGSLLLMYGRCQQNWKHSVPRSRALTQPRINLTFRQVLC